RARNRPGERHLLPPPRGARPLPRRSKRNGAAPSLRVLLLCLEGGTTVGEPFRDDRRGAGPAQGARPPHALGGSTADLVSGGRLMLYRPEAFEPLVDTPWSELRARAAIREI